MDSPTLTTVSSAFSVLAPLPLVVLFFWACWRTESRHLLVYRLWQLIHGSQEISDPDVRAFINEQTSLMSFRFVTGVKVATLQHARKLIEWTRCYGVEMRTVALCGEYFDPDLRQLRSEKLPSKLVQRTTLLFSVLAILICFGSAFVVTTDRAILKFKESDRWFTMSSNEARAIWPFKGNPVRKTDCSSDKGPKATRIGFKEHEVLVLCDLFNHHGVSDFVDSTVKDQRVSSLAMTGVTLWAAWFLITVLMRIGAAKRLERRQLFPDPSGGQLSLDFIDREDPKSTFNLAKHSGQKYD